MTGTYQPSGLHRRTDAERFDQLLSWRRSDRAFFAAGACHILAFTFLERAEAGGFSVVGLRRAGAPAFDHLFASDGEWAFDYCGWTPERELIEATTAFERLDVPYERVVVEGDLADLCAAHPHRPPADFAHDPRPRARRYITQLLTDGR